MRLRWAVSEYQWSLAAREDIGLTECRHITPVAVLCVKSRLSCDPKTREVV